MRFPIFASSPAALSTTVQHWQTVTMDSFSGAGNATAASSGVLRCFIPFRCQISQLTVEFIGAPGAGKSYTVCLTKNQVDTALSVSIADANTIASTTTQSVIFEEDDYISIHFTPVGTPAAPTVVRWSFIVDTLGRPEYFYFRSYGSAATGSRSYGSVSTSANGWTTSATSIVARSDMAHAGTITKVKYWHDRTPGAGKTYTMSLYKNGAEEASTIGTIDNTSQYVSISGLNISLAKDDIIKASALPAGTPASGHMSVTVVVRPNIIGEYSVHSCCYNPVGTATQWMKPFASMCAPTTGAEAAAQQTGLDNIKFYVKNLTVNIESAPGAAKSYDFTLTKNGSDTAMTCQIAGGSAKKGTDNTHIIAFDVNSTAAIKIVPTSSPATTGGVSVNCVIFIPIPKIKPNH